MRLLREPRRLFRLAGDTHSLKTRCDRVCSNSTAHRLGKSTGFSWPAIAKSADFSMGTGDAEDALLANSSCPPATGACHAPVHASREKIDFGTNFICEISMKENSCYQRKSGNTPRRSRYSCRACSRSSALGAVLYFAYSSCLTRASSFCSNPCRISASYSSS